MKTAAAMGLAMALLGNAAWGATVDAQAPTATIEPAASVSTGVLPADPLAGAEVDPFAAKDAPAADGPLALLGVSKSSPLPDSATWAMMIIGFFGAGYLLRSGRSGGLRILREAKADRPVGKSDAATH